MIKVTRSAVIDAPIEQVWALLRDFNSHSAWHPAVGDSQIENGEPADQIGCVRNFFLKDGNHIREQLLALSDEQHISTYCILDATLPMKRYVATLRLSPVTDGNRCFWHWQSSFDIPKGREREFDELVGNGVYQTGFAGLSSFLRKTRGALWNPDQSAKPPTVAGVSSSGLSNSTTAMRAQGIVANSLGGVEVLKYQDVTAAAPGPGEVRLRQTVIGVNYIDVYVRNGQYRMIKPPQALGMEAAGVVIDVGTGVAHLLPGDRVAYACVPVGSYVSARTMPADSLVVLPDTISDEVAATLMLKGLTAEYLLHRTCRVRAGDVVLVHAAAGGVGLFLCQWAKSLGATVIGTVSSEEKARIARANGCAHPIITNDYRFADQVQTITAGRGVSCIFDGLGREAFEDNLAALAYCGHWVSFGQASGAQSAIALERLSEKSITLSRPVLFHYTRERRVLLEMARNTFEAYSSGILRVDIRHRYPLASAAQAHSDLEARRTAGPIVLLV